MEKTPRQKPARETSPYTSAGRVRRLRDLRTWFLAVGCFVIALVGAYVAFNVGFAEGATYLFFVSCTIGIAYVTRSYAVCVLTCVVCALIQDRLFIRPYYSFGIDHKASIATFCLFGLVCVVVGCMTVYRGRQADMQDAARRRTQVLFDLTKTLFYAHGTAETVDTALSSIESLFVRSCAIYLRDPFLYESGSEADRKNQDVIVRVVDNDLGEEAFLNLIEKYVVHWVYENKQKAGGQTDYHEQSDIIYLPLLSQNAMEGVLAVSIKAQLLSSDDLVFLDLVSDQITLALERQSLNTKHRRDVRAMHTTEVRCQFMNLLQASCALAAQSVHTFGDALLTVPQDELAQREILERAISDETARTQIMLERVQTALKSESGDLCDLAQEVSSLCDVMKSALEGRVLQMDVTQSTPSLLCDVALIRLAVSLILEAACAFVEKGGLIEISVRASEDDIVLVIQDDRPDLYCLESNSASDLSAAPPGASENQVPTDRAGNSDTQPAMGVFDATFEASRSRALRRVLLDRETLQNNSQAYLETLLQAAALPREAGYTQATRDSLLNRQRVLRLDRLMYGLYIAALIVSTHKGTLKQRKRIGGGVVLTMTLPRR